MTKAIEKSAYDEFLSKGYWGGGACAPQPAPGVKKPDPTPAGEGQANRMLVPGPSKSWRAYCLNTADKAHIPAGYTYLGQLIGHDMGSSVRMAEMPVTLRGSAQTRQRFNLIDAPLSLETIYGPGPSMLSHVFDPATLLFRIGSRERISRTIGTPGLRIRALYDRRNRDTLMLHELAAIWMKYHNRIATQVAANGGFDPAQAYGIARRHVVRAWHRIIRGDFLPHLMDPAVTAMSPGKMALVPELDETTLLHGLFRAFHCMPRSIYQLRRGKSDSHFLHHLLLGPDGSSRAEKDRWSIDWSLFLSDDAGATKTGMTASSSPDLILSEGKHLRVLDLKTATETGPLALGNPGLQGWLAQINPNWCDQMSAGALAAGFLAFWNGYAAGHPDAAKSRGKAMDGLDADAMRAMPLYEIIKIEAQLYGLQGRLGPFGSLLLRRSIEASIDRLEFSENPQKAKAPELPELPGSMLELITNLQQGE